MATLNARLGDPLSFDLNISPRNLPSANGIEAAHVATLDTHTNTVADDVHTVMLQGLHGDAAQAAGEGHEDAETHGDASYTVTMREGPLASIRFEGLPEGSMLRYWLDGQARSRDVHGSVSVLLDAESPVLLQTGGKLEKLEIGQVGEKHTIKVEHKEEHEEHPHEDHKKGDHGGGHGGDHAGGGHGAGHEGNHAAEEQEHLAHLRHHQEEEEKKKREEEAFLEELAHANHRQHGDGHHGDALWENLAEDPFVLPFNDPFGHQDHHTRVHGIGAHNGVAHGTGTDHNGALHGGADHNGTGGHGPNGGHDGGSDHDRNGQHRDSNHAHQPEGGEVAVEMDGGLKPTLLEIAGLGAAAAYAMNGRESPDKQIPQSSRVAGKPEKPKRGWYDPRRYMGL